MLLAIDVPKVNGYEACRQIRAQPGGTDMALMAITGWGQPEDRRASQGAGFDHAFSGFHPSVGKQHPKEPGKGKFATTDMAPQVASDSR